MGKLTVTMWLTLDGFAAGPNGELDWINGADDMAEYEVDAVASRDAVLFGSKTYKEFSGYWPHVQTMDNVMDWEKVHGKNMTEKRKYVISSSLTKDDAKWENTEIINELSAERIKQLKEDCPNGILIYGSLNIIQQLTNMGLIDEYQLLVHPLALSEGKPLFANLDERLNLSLVSSRQLSTEVLIQTLVPRK